MKLHNTQLDNLPTLKRGGEADEKQNNSLNICFYPLTCDFSGVD